MFTSRSSSDTGISFGLPLEGRLTNTRSFPSAWPWHRERSRSAWMLHWPLEVPGHSCSELLKRLILAHSRELVSRHRDIVLRHIHSLGLRMNAKKIVLFPSQQTVFLGIHLDSVQMQARLAPAGISNFTTCLVRFKLGHHVSVSTCRRLLGLMAVEFLWWMKGLRLHPTIPATRLIRVSRSCFRPLLQWRDPAFLQSGVRMGAIHHRIMITKADGGMD